MLAENLQQVNANIEKACAAVSRDPGEVTLVAVSKTKPVSMLQEAYDAGARVLEKIKSRRSWINMTSCHQISSGT